MLVIAITNSFIVSYFLESITQQNICNNYYPIEKQISNQIGLNLKEITNLNDLLLESN